MVLTLAFRNLFHDRIRLAVTLVGILFSIVLVAVQLGLYQGATKMIVGMIENARGELWVTSYGAKSFEEAGQLSGRERYAVLSVPGVQSVTPLAVSFADWRKPKAAPHSWCSSEPIRRTVGSRRGTSWRATCTTSTSRIPSRSTRRT